MALLDGPGVRTVVLAWWALPGTKTLAALRATLAATMTDTVCVAARINGNVLTVDIEEKIVLVYTVKSFTWTPASGNLSEVLVDGGSTRSDDAVLLNWGILRSWVSIQLAP